MNCPSSGGLGDVSIPCLIYVHSPHSDTEVGFSANSHWIPSARLRNHIAAHLHYFPHRCTECAFKGIQAEELLAHAVYSGHSTCSFNAGQNMFMEEICTVVAEECRRRYAIDLQEQQSAATSTEFSIQSDLNGFAGPSYTECASSELYLQVQAVQTTNLDSPPAFINNPVLQQHLIQEVQPPILDSPCNSTAFSSKTLQSFANLVQQQQHGQEVRQEAKSSSPSPPILDGADLADQTPILNGPSDKRDSTMAEVVVARRGRKKLVHRVKREPGTEQERRWKRRPFCRVECTRCGELVPDSMAYRINHANHKHFKLGLLKCRLCPKEFLSAWRGWFTTKHGEMHGGTGREAAQTVVKVDEYGDLMHFLRAKTDELFGPMGEKRTNGSDN